MSEGDLTHQLLLAIQSYAIVMLNPGSIPNENSGLAVAVDLDLSDMISNLLIHRFVLGSVQILDQNYS